MSRARGAITGAVTAVVVVAALHYPAAATSMTLLALFLALTACVYLGALLAQRQTAAIAVSELIVGSTVFLCAVLGLLVSDIWIAVGYSLHGLWDWAHDFGLVTTKIARWFPPLCAVFDFVVAAFVVVIHL